MTETKLAIMELFSKYLLCLDERRFDVNSFAEIFTENAEVIMPSRLLPAKNAEGFRKSETFTLHYSFKLNRHATLQAIIYSA